MARAVLFGGITMFKNILLCTHSTSGGHMAEELVFKKLCGEAEVTVLTVINKDWELMTGDDWLNTSKTQRNFMAHVNAQISSETEEEWDKIKEKYPAASGAKFIMEVGDVEETIVSVAKKIKADLIVIGPYQKVRKGFRSRIENKTFHALLPVPLMVAPKV